MDRMSSIVTAVAQGEAHALPIAQPEDCAQVRGHYRHTKIVVTVGPATESDEQIRRLIDSGVDMLRLNMAHTTADWVKTVVGRIREVSAEAKRHVAIMMDVKGPEIRTGLVSEGIDLKAGETFEFYTQTPTEGVRGIDVNYPGLPLDVQVGATVLVDSGLIRLQIIAKDDTHVRCRVLVPGRLGSKRHINLPGVHVRLPAITAKDEEDLRLGAEIGIDFVALSFARQGADIQILRRLLDELGSRARIIAKIEDQTGLRNLEAIVQNADAVMVARGDLGIEIDYQYLPLVQERIVEACLAQGKPVIIATQLLESMMSSPMPTRAEITDVSNAVKEMADAVMLSGETTTGQYPLECVEVLKNIITCIEPSEKKRLNEVIRLAEPKTKMLRSAAVLAQDLGSSGIIVFTRSGLLAYMLAALRAQGVPIYAFTDVEEVFRQLLLPWGVEPFFMEFSQDPEDTIMDAMAYLKRRNWCSAGTWLVVITNALAHDMVVDTIQLRQVG